MKYKLFATISFVIIFVATLLFQTNLYAQSTIAIGCEAAQQYLKAAQKPRDLRTRVDRLQAYRYVHQRLDATVRRIERNNQPNAKNLRANVDRLNDVTEAFRLDYETYDAAREAAANVKDCRNNGSEFAQKLEEARNARATVAQDVSLIRSIIATNITEQLQVTARAMDERGEN